MGPILHLNTSPSLLCLYTSTCIKKPIKCIWIYEFCIITVSVDCSSSLLNIIQNIALYMSLWTLVKVDTDNKVHLNSTLCGEVYLIPMEILWFFFGVVCQSVLNLTLFNKLCQWLAAVWFSSGTPVSTNKTGHHDILLKMVLNMHNL